LILESLDSSCTEFLGLAALMEPTMRSHLAIAFVALAVTAFGQMVFAEEPTKVASDIRFVIYAEGLNGPRGLLINKKGELYAVEQNGGTLVQIDEGQIIRHATGFSAPHDVAADSEGNFFVADTGNDRIARVTAAGKVQTYVDGLKMPVDLAFNAAGELLVCEYGAQRVTAFTPSKKRRVFASGFTPHGLAFAPGGLTLVNDLSNKRIVAIKADGTAIPMASNIDTPIGLAIGPSGDIYVAESKVGKLYRINRNGTRALLLEGLARPRDPIFDNDGNLYLAETNAGRVLKITGRF
jgi:serine/threonine-protein kinase